MTREEVRLKYKLQFERDISIALKVVRSFENKINNLHIALDKANKRRKAQAEEINRLLFNKQATSDLKVKYDRLELDYVEMRSSLNMELLEHKAIIKYLEGKIK